MGLAAGSGSYTGCPTSWGLVSLSSLIIPLIGPGMETFLLLTTTVYVFWEELLSFKGKCEGCGTCTCLPSGFGVTFATFGTESLAIVGNYMH